MARPHGFDHFCDYLKGLESYYVIIGGGAASILMDDGGIGFRSTKDVDLVVLTRSKELTERILAYVKAGDFQTKESTERVPKYYRFTKPNNKDCPKMIEIFARNELGLELEKGQHIIPIKDDSVDKLSAILLDDEYFDLIQKNLITSDSGIPIINAIANVCLKARAHRELFERKRDGDTTIDEKDILKHLKDIWRLAAVLTGDESVALVGAPARDIAAAIIKLEKLPEEQFSQVTENIPGAGITKFMSALKKVFVK